MKTVLYIDDDPAILNLAKHVFIHTSANLLIAKNVRDAVEIINTSQIDVIVLDLILDNECGLDILDKIKKTRFKNVKIIIVSGWINQFVDRLKKYTGIRLDFLDKPYSANELIKKINEC